jgi:hypothetical protein
MPKLARLTKEGGVCESKTATNSLELKESYSPGTKGWNLSVKNGSLSRWPSIAVIGGDVSKGGGESVMGEEKWVTLLTRLDLYFSGMRLAGKRWTLVFALPL